MSPPETDYSWLPDHQLHVVATLAHVDHTIEQLLQLAHAYTQQGPITFEEVVHAGRVDVVVKAVAPLPQAIPRLVAGALTQLRAALEHVLYAEVEAGLGRSLTDEEARAVEMPAATDAGTLAKWFRNRRRSQLPPLRAGSPLAQRVERLQPFQRPDVDEHPMRLLAEHTNLAKHRTPAVAATRLGAVYPDDPRSDLTVALPLSLRPQPGDGLPLREGDTLASAPRGAKIPFSVVPTVSLRRPHTGVWCIAAHELQDLEEWVRAIAVPILVTGTHEVSPLPPQLDISVGHRDLRTELASAGRRPATARARDKIMAAVARGELADILTLAPDAPDKATLQLWADSLDDATAMQHVIRLQAVSGRPQELIEVCRGLIALSCPEGTPSSPRSEPSEA
jgi:hypothetical protein